VEKERKKKSVGVQDIARKLNISASTVSRALNDHPKIRRETKEKVLDAAIKMGYNPAVPGLMLPDKNDIIALVVPDLNKVFYRKIIDGARDALLMNALDLIVIVTKDNEEITERLPENYLKMNLRGLIYVVSSKSNPLSALNSLYKNNIPCVFINRIQKEFPFTYVIPDVFQGAYDLTIHMIESGCRTLALFAENPDDLIDTALADGFHSALAEQGIEITKHDVFFISPDYKHKQEITTQLTAMLYENSLPDGLLASSPETAHIMLNFLNENGLHVPADIFLAVVGEDQYTLLLKPSLSGLVLPGNKLGQTAANELLKQFKDIDYQKRTIIQPVKFIIKNSTLKL